MRDLFPFERNLIEQKIKEAHATIEKALEVMKNPYIAWSGGKDSTIVVHMVIQHKPDILVVHWDADCDFPETVEYMERLCREWKLNFLSVKTKPLLQVVAKYAYTEECGKMALRYCVYEPIKKTVKEFGLDGCFLGVRQEESYRRSKLLRAQGKLFFNKGYGIWQCLPIGWWTVEDVWRYYAFTKIPLNPLYDRDLLDDKDQLRVSYFAGGVNRERGRFVTLKFYHLGLYNRIRQRTKWVGFFS